MRQLGSVTDDSEVTFEFSVRPEAATPAAPKTDASVRAPEHEEDASAASADAPATPSTVHATVGQLQQLPFQMRIHYTKLNGMKCLRVVTKSKPVTRDRAAAERV